MNKEDIQIIVGTQQKHNLQKYVLTKGGAIVESKLLEYDDFMECYGINNGISFEVVIIEKESDNLEELKNKRKIEA